MAMPSERQAVQFTEEETASPRASMVESRATGREQTQTMTNKQSASTSQAPGQARRRTTRGGSQSSIYKEYIIRHAQRLSKRHYYFGAQFSGLSNMMRTGPDTQPPPMGPDFPYVVARTFGATATEPREFDAAAGHETFMALADPPDGAAQIVFVRGFPSPKWIVALGQRFKLDIEFFRNHLNFLEDFNYYTEPPWPSACANFLRLRVPTLIQRHSGLHRDDIKDMREREFSGARDYQRSLRYAGESIVRRMCIHDKSLFSVEQEIIISVIKRANGWTAVVWLDHGKLLPFDEKAPWQSGTTKQQKNRAQLEVDSIPLPQPLPPKLLPRLEEIDARKVGDPTDVATHSAFFLPYGYGITLKPDLMRVDPFYGLSGVLKYAINAQNQFLNSINHGVNQSMARADDVVTALADLNYSRRLIADSLVHLQDIEAFLKQVNEKFWTIKELTPAGIEAYKEVMQDLASAIRRAQSLSTSTSQGMSFITDGIMIVDSKRADKKADVMQRLTRLAGIFLPLSFTVSLFGANIYEFGSGKLSLWVMVLTFLPIVALVVLICFWEIFVDLASEGWHHLVAIVHPYWRRFWNIVLGRPW